MESSADIVFPSLPTSPPFPLLLNWKRNARETRDKTAWNLDVSCTVPSLSPGRWFQIALEENCLHCTDLQRDRDRERSSTEERGRGKKEFSDRPRSYIIWREQIPFDHKMDEWRERERPHGDGERERERQHGEREREMRGRDRWMRGQSGNCRRWAGRIVGPRPDVSLSDWWVGKKWIIASFLFKLLIRRLN